MPLRKLLSKLVPQASRAGHVAPSDIIVPRSPVFAFEVFESRSLLKALEGLREEDSQHWDTPLQDEQERNSLYASCSSSLPTREEVIFYESMSGARVMDNPYSIFENVVDSGELSPTTIHIWSAGDEDWVPHQLRERDNVFIVKRHSPLYIYLLASAKHVIGNSPLPGYFVRKPDQKYLNTWLGIGYKRLDRSPRKPFGTSLTAANMLQATHIISPCRFMTDIMLNGFSLRGTFTGKMAETGYPRIDATLNASAETIDTLHRVLGTDRSKKTVLYAPTWRGEGKAAEKQLGQLEKDLSILTRIDANIIFLAHHITAQRLQEQDFPSIHVPPPGVITNELLALADVLITDYSSIFFDFLVTRRPIIHYLYDYRTYKSAQELTLELEELPGEVAFDTVALQALTHSAVKGHVPYSQRYEEARVRFCPHEDGSVAERVSRWFFKGEETEVQQVSLPDNRPRVVFWGGRLPESDALAPFLAHLRKRVKSGSEQITLVVAGQARKNALLKELLQDLGTDVDVVTRGRHEMGKTPLEFEARQVPAKERTKVEGALYDEMYRREYSRLLGDTKFDEVIPYQELTHFWSKLSDFALKD